MNFFFDRSFFTFTNLQYSHELDLDYHTEWGVLGWGLSWTYQTLSQSCFTYVCQALNFVFFVSCNVYWLLDCYEFWTQFVAPQPTQPLQVNKGKIFREIGLILFLVKFKYILCVYCAWWSSHLYSNSQGASHNWFCKTLSNCDFSKKKEMPKLSKSAFSFQMRSLNFVDKTEPNLISVIGMNVFRKVVVTIGAFLVVKILLLESNLEKHWTAWPGHCFLRMPVQ